MLLAEGTCRASMDLSLYCIFDIYLLQRSSFARLQESWCWRFQCNVNISAELITFSWKADVFLDCSCLLCCQQCCWTVLLSIGILLKEHLGCIQNEKVCLYEQSPSNLVWIESWTSLMVCIQTTIYLTFLIWTKACQQKHTTKHFFSPELQRRGKVTRERMMEVLRFATLARINFLFLCQRQVQPFYLLLWYGEGMLQGGY